VNTKVLTPPAPSDHMDSIRIRRAALVLLALAPAAACAPATAPLSPAGVSAVPAPAVAFDPALRAVDSLLRATYPDGGPGAAVLVARGDQVLLRRGFGSASVELAVPMTPEHVLRIGSITKQFTAVGILVLVDEGRLSLQDEITRFFPDWPTHGHRITVEHLLTHTSGIRSYTAIPGMMQLARRDVPLSELIAFFREEPMDFPPGTDFRYNNSAYVLLGAIIEQLSGQSYADFIRTRLFEPLGMADTRYEDLQEITPRRTAGYGIRPDRSLRNAEFLSPSVPHAAGALVSTVDDMYRWQRAVAARRLLSPATWEAALQPYRLADGRGSGYGYGWFLGRAAGRPTVEHGGDIPGFAAEGMWIPAEDLHVVVLSNVERNFANPATVVLRAAETLLGAPASPAAGTPASPAGPLSDYAGVYRISADERRVVFVEGDTLYSVRGQGTRQAMRPVGGDTFEYAVSGTRVEFARDAAGRVASMRLLQRLGPEPLPDPRTDEDPARVLAAAHDEGVTVPAEVLDSYVGVYELAPGFELTIRRGGEGIVGQATGQPQFTLRARSEARFSILETPATIEFLRDTESGEISLVLDQGGRRMPAHRVR
jgi:D-alanyl-D-alanine carboxypeptidase